MKKCHLTIILCIFQQVSTIPISKHAGLGTVDNKVHELHGALHFLSTLQQTTVAESLGQSNPTEMSILGQAEVSAKEAVNCQSVKTIVCIAGCVSLIGVLSMTFRSLARSEPAAAEKRIHVFDNARFFAMMLVVYGHFFTLNHGLGWAGGKYLSQLFQVEWSHPEVAAMSNVYTLLYRQLHILLAMPLFTVLSGILSQGGPTAKRFRALVVNILLPAWAYGYIVNPITTVSWHQMAQTNFTEALDIWWAKCHFGIAGGFLTDLFRWRLIAFACAELATRTGVRLDILTVCIAIPFVTAAPYDKWYIPQFLFVKQGFFGMMPLFIVGLLVPVRQLLQHGQDSLPTRIVTPLFLIMWLGAQLGPSLLAQAAIEWKRLPFRGEKAGEVWRPPPVCFMEDSLAWTWGLFRCLSAGSMILAFLAAICPRQQYWFTAVGQNAIFAYLLHFPLRNVLDSLMVFLPEPKLGPPLPHLVGLMLLYMAQWAVTLCVVSMLTSKPMRWLMAPLLQPQWLGNLIFGSPENNCLTESLSSPIKS
mmetsp:Transcript_109069/g.352077  ORF Transcript_109069/g.352077 Transcript_109069/m.352077 type:complete len:531 (-) Transcript_109069:114-1706(-)